MSDKRAWSQILISFYMTESTLPMRSNRSIITIIQEKKVAWI